MEDHTTKDTEKVEKQTKKKPSLKEQIEFKKEDTGKYV